MKGLTELENKLLGQDFIPQESDGILEQYKQIAAMYAQTENSIAVLSDLKVGRSHIYNGGLSEALGLYPENCTEVIDSIWEEEIYSRIHPEDLSARHMLELKFFQLLKKTPIEERRNYRTHSVLRMSDEKGKYIPVLHRTFYLCNQSNGSLWIALCLYNFSPNVKLGQHFEGVIQNSATGELIEENNHLISEIISVREKDVLRLIEQGFPSKQIAIKLGISKNTVDRHRQNIMEKLRVGNSVEAIKVARGLNLM